MEVIVAGDFCTKEILKKQLVLNKHDVLFSEIRPLVTRADYAIVNLECPILTSLANPIKKVGPSLSTLPEIVDSIKYAGFTCCTLANNHFRDFGDEGCLNTIAELDNAHIDHVGGGKDIYDAQKALYKKIGNQNLAIVNFCEHEFSIATSTEAGSAPMNLIDVYRQITEANKIADYVLVVVHGGHEYYQLPSPRMQKTYRWFIELGADAVVNHHQHCFSGYEVYNGKPIFYGLGNFCFDTPSPKPQMWYEGYMVNINFQKELISFKLFPYVQCKDDIGVHLTEKKEFDETISVLNQIISSPEELQRAYDSFTKSCRSKYAMSLQPYSSDVARGLYRRGLLPGLFSEKKKISLENFIMCESHREKLLDFLRSERLK